jgi:hypothetical protein
MIDAKELLRKLSSHVASCKSSSFLCSVHAAFESWFRVELVPVLQELQYPSSSIETNYTYPNSNDKADLCVRDILGDIIFELKSFVHGQDSNKKQKYPSQIKKLEKLIANHSVLQVLALTTFIGYSETQMANYTEHFFASGSWNVLGPLRLVKQYPLHIAIASIVK